MKDDYDKFMLEYKLLHELCPQCGTKEHSTTLMGFILDLSDKESYQDTNRCECVKCGNIHTYHERISEKEFLKRKRSKKFTSDFRDADKECSVTFGLLRRVYDIIEMSHLNDGKLIPIYCQKFEFPRKLGDDIFNLLSSKDQFFRDTTIKRQKRFRNKQKKDE